YYLTLAVDIHQASLRSYRHVSIRRPTHRLPCKAEVLGTKCLARPRTQPFLGGSAGSNGSRG
ncbi:hypothetical protein ABTK37_20360, partial [Acinetobacter baumannii]